MNTVIDNAAGSRFELMEQGKLAFANYRLLDGVLVIPYVEAHPDLRGTGTAGRLMEGVMKSARERGLKVRPICGYAVAWMQRHPETMELLENPKED